MLERFVEKSNKHIEQNRPIPNWFLFSAFLAIVIPLGQEFLTEDNLDWLWFLFIVPVSLFSYYKGIKQKVMTVSLLSLTIIFSEYYNHSYLSAGDLDKELAVAFGVVLSMVIASVVISILAKKIQVARKSYDLISKTTNLAIEIIDSSGEAVYINQAFANLKKSEKPELLGSSFRDADYQKDLTTTLCLKKNFSGKEYLEAADNGNQKFLMGDTFLLQSKCGKVLGAMLTLKDISEKKSIESKVRQAEKFKVLGQMAAGLAHEIRNPLTSIRGFLQLHYLRNEDQSDREFIKIMLEEIDRVNKLLSEFLVLAKKVPSKKEMHSLKVVLTKIVALVNSKAVLKNIKLKINATEKLPMIIIDSEQIKQVMINLIQNAIEAMPQGGNLDIDVSYQAGHIKVSITDTGEGIDLAIVDKVCNPFYTTKPEGTGLGLALCQRIIENHAGKLEIESKVGVGTKVTILLPTEKVA